MKSYEQEVYNVLRGVKANEEKVEEKEEESVDEAMTSGAIHPMALHVKPVQKDGKPMYQVHAVGKKLSGGISKGEHLSDSDLDDATEMGAKIKHIKEEEEKVEEMSSKMKMKLGLYNKKSKNEEVQTDDVDFTVIEHNAFSIDLPENLTYVDYLNAAKTYTESDEEAIIIADKFFKEQDESIVLESFTRSDIEDRANNWGKAGHQVSLPKYTTKDGKLHAEFTVTDKDSGQKTKYVYHGTKRSVSKI